MADTAPPQALSHYAIAIVVGFHYFFATKQITGIKIPRCSPRDLFSLTSARSFRWFIIAESTVRWFVVREKHCWIAVE
jgi:hypothetical protein